jgi:hypothetical protein
VANAGTSNQDRTISLKVAVRNCINKQQPGENNEIFGILTALLMKIKS